MVKIQYKMLQDSASIKDLRFPIISFGKGNVINFSRSEDELTTCTEVGFRNGYFNNLQLVDSSGLTVVIRKANKIGSVGPLWGFNLLKGRKIKVDFEFSSKSDLISLDDLKSRILKVFKSDEYFWDSDGELGKRKAFVQNAKTHEEIIHRMTEEFYKEYK